MIADEAGVSAAGLVGRPAAAEGFAHTALFYRGAAEFLSGCVPFVLAALAVAEPVLVAVPRNNLQLLRTELFALVGQAVQRVLMVDLSREGRNPGWIIPGVLRPFIEAYPAGDLRVVTESTWAGRAASEYPACLQHEALVNLAFADRSVTVLCPFDVARLGTSALADAGATHSALVDRTGSRRTSGRYAPERVLAHCNAPLPEPTGTATVFVFRDADLERVRKMALARAIRAGLQTGRADDVELAVNELAVNTLLHGGGQGTLRIWVQDGYLICEVSDAGHIDDPLVGRRLVDPGSPGGRGVLIVNRLADLVRMYIGPGGNTVRAQFAL